MTTEVSFCSRALPGSSQSLTGVIAGSDLPSLVTIGPYPADVPIGVNTTDEHITKYRLHVHFEDGRLLLKNDVTNEWPRHLHPCVDVTKHWPQLIQPARDRHEQNVEAYRDDRDNVMLRVQRPICKNEELLVWYSDDLARCVGIPFLTPDNIRGNQEYRCSKCHKTYRYPNTLKAHIRFRCSVTQKQNEQVRMNCVTSFKDEMGVQSHSSPLPPMGAFLQRRCTPPILDSWYSTKRKRNTLLLSELSAFKPHRAERDPAETEPDSTTVQSSTSPGKDSAVLNLSTRDHSNTASVSSMPLSLQLWKPFHQPAIPITVDALTLCYPYLENIQRHNTLLCSSEQTTSLNRLASRSISTYHQLLATPGMNASAGLGQHGCQDKTCTNAHSASNFSFPLPSEQEGEPLDLLPRSLYLSKSRKGHLCIYCGKLYSRKYGLKIHLRTHTGYKPLKCKVCLRPFGDPSNLNKHVRLHAEGDTPYRCQYCGKVLVRRRDLERHVKSRHPQEAELKETMIDSVDTTTENVETDQITVV